MKPAIVYKLRARISAVRAQLEDLDRVLEQMLPSGALAAKRAKAKAAKKARRDPRQIDLEELIRATRAKKRKTAKKVAKKRAAKKARKVVTKKAAKKGRAR